MVLPKSHIITPYDVVKCVLSYNPWLFHDLWKHNCLKNQEVMLFFILRIMIMTKQYQYHDCEEYIMILDIISITYLSALLICLVAVIIPAYVRYMAGYFVISLLHTKISYCKHHDIQPYNTGHNLEHFCAFYYIGHLITPSHAIIHVLVLTVYNLLQ